MPNVDVIEPFWPDATTAGVQRWPRNHGIALGAMDSAPTAHADYVGGLFVVPGTPDVFYVNVQSPTAGTYSLQRLGTNRQRVLSADALDTAGALALTADMSGALIRIDAAAMAFTVPALTAANSGADGLVYEFLVTTTSTTVTFTAGAADLLQGGVTISSTTVNEGDAFSADGSDDLIFTMNGTTKGGIIGSWFKVWAASATAWLITGNLLGSGTLVTPFS
jgi:hypothetical protein